MTEKPLPNIVESWLSNARESYNREVGIPLSGSRVEQPVVYSSRLHDPYGRLQTMNRDEENKENQVRQKFDRHTFVFLLVQA